MSLRLLLLGLAALAGLAGTASAHALVTESEPAAAVSLDSPPREVTLRFNSRIDPERSRLVLVGPEGAQLPLSATAPDPATLAAPCPAIGPGAWRIRWQVLAVDGHITRGDIPFTVMPH